MVKVLVGIPLSAYDRPFRFEGMTDGLIKLTNVERKQPLQFLTFGHWETELPVAVESF